MRKVLMAIFLLAFIVMGANSSFAEKEYKMFASDSVGVKLEYPPEWNVKEFRWGFAVTDPATQSTVTAKSQFFPKEYEQAYDINFNKEFEQVYTGKFESLVDEEREHEGLKWDYAKIVGAKGSALEYNQETYTTLIQNTLYTVELYYNTTVSDDVKKSLKKIVASVKIMYKESELPLIREYMKDYNNALAKNKSLSFATGSKDIRVEYSPTWAFSGSGSGSECGFHYFTGDPFKDIDMIIIKHESKNPREAIIALKTWVGLLTDTFIMDDENTIEYGRDKYHYQKLFQGKGEHIIHTWLFATQKGEGTVVAVFAFHNKAIDEAPQVIDEFMKKVSLR